MDSASNIAQLQRRLRLDVAYMCRRRDRIWSDPIVRTLQDLREMRTRAALFGGTLRSLLLSRIERQRLGRPRDIDIVVEGTALDELRARFRDITVRETRFGGLQLQRMEWQFDVWPLDRTWAFVQDSSFEPKFATLPSTTFFNLEAIAIDVWAAPGHARTVYAGNGQFFEGILSRTLEINRETNPFPGLCVVRALIMASATGFSIGPHLARYLAVHGPAISDDELMELQRKHYGRPREYVATLRRWLDHVRRCHDRSHQAPIRLPRERQLMLWDTRQEEDHPKLKFHVLPAQQEFRKLRSDPISIIEQNEPAARMKATR